MMMHILGFEFQVCCIDLPWLSHTHTQSCHVFASGLTVPVLLVFCNLEFSDLCCHSILMSFDRNDFTEEPKVGIVIT